jgi:hypothetical protein
MNANVKQGSLVIVTRATHAGIETILGRVTAGEIAEIEGREVMTHVIVEGTVQHTKIGNMLIPEEREVTLNMIPVESTHPELLKLEVVKAQ